jgi:hypothetical protein
MGPVRLGERCPRRFLNLGWLRLRHISSHSFYVRNKIILEGLAASLVPSEHSTSL